MIYEELQKFEEKFLENIRISKGTDDLFKEPRYHNVVIPISNYVGRKLGAELFPFIQFMENLSL